MSERRIDLADTRRKIGIVRGRADLYGRDLFYVIAVVEALIEEALRLRAENAELQRKAERSVDRSPPPLPPRTGDLPSEPTTYAVPSPSGSAPEQATRTKSPVRHVSYAEEIGAVIHQTFDDVLDEKVRQEVDRRISTITFLPTEDQRE